MCLPQARDWMWPNKLMVKMQTRICNTIRMSMRTQQLTRTRSSSSSAERMQAPLIQRFINQRAQIQESSQRTSQKSLLLVLSIMERLFTSRTKSEPVLKTATADGSNTAKEQKCAQVGTHTPDSGSKV